MLIVGKYNTIMNEESFEKIVSQAIDNIPEQYQLKIKNVVFKVEDMPSEEQRKKLGLRDCDALFGLYEGVPLTKRNGAVHSIVPDVITIFRRPMIDIHRDDNDLKKQIFETVWHEVAHYFGLNHEMIDDIKNIP
jgi:predicted Zn-dependent protease with MMP-like domain